MARAVNVDLKRYAAGEALEACAALGELMADLETGLAFAQNLITRSLSAMRERPFSEAPFRFRVSDGLSKLTTMTSGGATLSLVAYEPLDRYEAPDSALFSDCELHELALSGAASGVAHRLEAEGALATRT